MKKKASDLFLYKLLNLHILSHFHFNYEILPKLNIADALNCTNEKVRKGL